MPLLILEGADGSGKSSLAVQLREEWNGPSKLLRQGPPPAGKSLRDVYEVPFHGYQPSATKLTVCDRWHLGELVYGPLLRGGSRLTLVERYHLELFLAGLGAVLLHVQVPDEDLHRRLRERGDGLVSIPQALEAASRYRALLHPRSATRELPVLSAVSPLATQSVRVLLRTAAAVTSGALSARGRYLGPVSSPPDLLLVGDRPNNRDASLPPFAPYDGRGCSRWAMEVFYGLGRHRTIGLINAHQHPDLERLCLRRGTRVVALGREAAKELDNLGLQHGTVNHPQWWKRFRFADQEGYATALLRAASTQEDYTRHA